MATLLVNDAAAYELLVHISRARILMASVGAIFTNGANAHKVNEQDIMAEIHDLLTNDINIKGCGVLSLLCKLAILRGEVPTISPNVTGAGTGFSPLPNMNPNMQHTMNPNFNPNMNPNMNPGFQPNQNMNPNINPNNSFQAQFARPAIQATQHSELDNCIRHVMVASEQYAGADLNELMTTALKRNRQEELYGMAIAKVFANKKSVSPMPHGANTGHIVFIVALDMLSALSELRLQYVNESGRDQPEVETAIMKKMVIALNDTPEQCDELLRLSLMLMLTKGLIPSTLGQQSNTRQPGQF